MSLDVFCVYGAPNLEHMRDVQIPALRAQARSLPLHLHVVNYAGPQALLADAGRPELPVTDWSDRREPRHIGFGEAVNFLYHAVRPAERFLLVNPDSLPAEGCIAALLARWKAERPGIIEARQWPDEHPKEYDAETGDTPWASGAFCLVDAVLFGAIGGFDPVYFLYCEDVDLSWRVWLAGRRVVYASEALCLHFTGGPGYRPDRLYYEHYFSSRNFIGLAYKFFGASGEKRALAYFAATDFPEAFKRRVVADYHAWKEKLECLPRPPTSPHLKIVGFNRYHQTRP